MNERLARVVAIARVDFLTRFRRMSTVVVFLLLSACAYLWIPPVASGRTIMQVGGHRAYYNSGALGMSTAVLGTLFIGLFGFYVISNALKRDVVSRCGYVIASTTMRGSEYLVAKFLGNVLFLSTFAFGFMLTSMIMQVVRGEAALEPLVFVKQYLLLLPPAIAFVSALAIVFESIPWLSGKFGDVVYFFAWLASLGVVASLIDKPNAPAWPRYLDFTSLGFAMSSMKETVHTDAVAIGGTSFDPKLAPFVYHGLTLDPAWIAPRIVATLLPMLLLVAARLFFHRFDPARVRGAAEKAKSSWMARFNALFKPVTRALYALGSRAGDNSLLGAARIDALVTLTGFPLAVAAAVGIGLATVGSSTQSFSSGVMPVAFALLALLLCDVASRDARAGTTALVFASPRLRAQFVVWKLLSAIVLSVAFMAVPIVRIIARQPSSLPALAVGILFVAAAATSLGTVSSNPKTFIVAFLSFWYVVVNDKGLTQALDFAGFYGHATALVVVCYAIAAAALLAVAEAFHRRRLAREF